MMKEMLLNFILCHFLDIWSKTSRFDGKHDDESQQAQTFFLFLRFGISKTF